MYEAKSCENQIQGRGVLDPKIKVAQNGLKHILVLEFLMNSFKLEVFCKWSQVSKQP